MDAKQGEEERKNNPNPHADEENLINDEAKDEKEHGEDGNQNSKGMEEEANGLGSGGGEGEGNGGNSEGEKVPVAKKQKKGEKKGSGIVTSDDFSRLPISEPTMTAIYQHDPDTCSGEGPFEAPLTNSWIGYRWRRTESGS